MRSVRFPRQKAASALKKRVLTNLYNPRPQLADTHTALDAAFVAAYGWAGEHLRRGPPARLAGTDPRRSVSRMRFTADGPAIPDILLEERDAGHVVFLCGAGVSIPAGLPGFVELTQHVIEQLDPPPGSEIRQALAAVLDETAVPGWRRPALDELFQLLHQVYRRDHIGRIVWERLRSIEPDCTQKHDIVARISATAHGQPQIVTTNFDRLFELALAPGKPSIYEPPMYPDLRHGVPATGITYLHGRLAGTASATHDYILSSADLGRAYLAEGWATAFVRQLLQHYTVVLLGYRAEDPPLKYLLQGLRSAGRQTGDHHLFAFAFDEGDSDAIRANWSDRGVQVIPYGDSHEALWETLGAWADRADNPASWRGDVVDLSACGPRGLAPHERGMVAHLVRTAIGAKEFADKKPEPPAEWLCVFDVSCRYAEPSRSVDEDATAFDPLQAYGLDDDPPRSAEREQEHGWPGDDLIRWRQGDESLDHWRRLTGISWPRRERMPSRLFHLARWLQSRIDDPCLAWWVAKQPSLHPELHAMLKSAVEDFAHLDSHVRRGWMTLFEVLETGPERAVDMECIRVRQSIKKRGWTSSAIRAFEAVTQPVFTIMGAYGNRNSRPPSGDWSTITWQDVANFSIHFPAHLADAPNPSDAALPLVYAALERNLMRASERIREAQWTWFCLSAFHAVDGSDAHHADEGPDAYVGRFRDFLSRLSRSTPERLRKHIDLWPAPEPHIFDQLRLYVWNKPELFSAEEAVGEVLALSDDQFWRPEHRRELMLLLRVRWTDFSAERRDLIGHRILDGPPRPHDEDEAEHAVRSAMTAAERFGCLVKAGCRLSASLRAKWTALKSGLPDWQDSWVDGASATGEVRSGWVGTNEDASALDGLPIGRIVQVAQEHSHRSGMSFVENRPFTGLVKNNPQRAIRALGAAARGGEFPEELWQSAMGDWPDHATRRATKLLHGRLKRLPCATIDALRGPVGDWLRERFPNAVVDDKALAYDVFDHFVGCLLAAGRAATEGEIWEQAIGGEAIQGSRQTFDQAINGPIGKAVEGLLKELSNGNPANGSTLPAELKARLDRLLTAPGEGSGHAVCVLSRWIAWLHYLDSAWVVAKLIPWFRGDHHRREAAWSGILRNPWERIRPVFGALKASFLALPPEMYTWASREETKQYCDWIVAASLLAGDDVARLSFKEARECLRRVNPEGRQNVIWFLAQVGTGNDGGWQGLVVPFIREAWPNEQEYQTGETTEAWLSLLKNAEDSFPIVLATIRDHLRPVNSGRPVLYAFHRDAGVGEPLPIMFPRETLDLLDRVVPASSRDVPYGLADVLGLIVEAEPALIGDARYRRLHGLGAGQ